MPAKMGKLIFCLSNDALSYLSFVPRIFMSPLLFGFDARQGAHVMKSEKRLAYRRTRKNMNLGFSVRYENIFFLCNYSIVSCLMVC